MAKKKLPKIEFKPDPTGSDHRKIFQLTGYQRSQILKWFLYAALTVGALLVQDTILARIRIGGATTDLLVGVVMLIAMLEGAENGGVFALLASVFYYLSGSAPGPYVVALVTAVAILGALYRQGYWSQSMSSTLLCSFLSLVSYEVLLLIMGIFLHLTVLRRIGVFVSVAVLTTIALVPLYYIARGIGQIGGELWKE